MEKQKYAKGSEAMNVVVVDDSPSSNKALESVLKGLKGVNTYSFADPQDALTYCIENDIDLLFLDYMMPKLDGLEFLKRLRAIDGRADIPVVMVTAADDRAVRLDALEAGATDFLNKPLDPLELRARARNMLKLRATMLDLTAANAELTRLATTDGLTGVANRRHFLERSEQELRRAQRTCQPICLLMVDADHFKNVNDTWGHAAGDDVLRALADRLRACVRDIDIVGRLGGEEFAVCLSDTTLEAGIEVAERIRNLVAATEVVSGKLLIPITVSIGATTLRSFNEKSTIEKLLEDADLALYSAKTNGRNRVFCQNS